MNVSSIFFSSFCLVSACTQVRDEVATPAEVEETSSAYTYDNGILTIGRDFNPYPGLTIGFFCDGCGTEDGWSRAIAIVPQTDEGDLTVNLGRYGAGTDTRWSLAVVDDNLVPTQWLWESGEIAAELERNDTLGLTIPVRECVGEVMVDKLDFCTQISGDSIMPGSCWGTYVEPESCTDADDDGDVDPDTTGDGGTDEDTDEDTDTVDNDGEVDEGCDDPDTTGDGGTDEDNDGDGWTTCEGDCDDGWAGTNPSHSSEWYDGMDNDCDGDVDEDCDGTEAWNGYCD